MQKALVVRAQVTETSAHSWSHEVDLSGAGNTSMRDLLESGWRIVHTCPMPGELDSCCLVVLEKNPTTPIRDLPLAALNIAPTFPTAANRPMRSWDGETIPLSIFGVTK